MVHYDFSVSLKMFSENPQFFLQFLRENIKTERPISDLGISPTAKYTEICFDVFKDQATVKASYICYKPVCCIELRLLWQTREDVLPSHAG